MERKILEVKKYTFNILLVFCSHTIIWKISHLIIKRQGGVCELFLHCLPESPRSNEQGRAELCEGLHMQTELQLVERPIQTPSFHSFFSEQHSVYNHSAFPPAVSLSVHQAPSCTSPHCCVPCSALFHSCWQLLCR